MKLYKYISSKYLDDFINKGIVLFRSLSYFKDYEDKQIRGDNLEGTLKYEPSDGLVINNLTTGKTFKHKGSFESTTKNNDIASSIMKCNTWESRKGDAILSVYGKTIQTSYYDRTRTDSQNEV